MENSAKESGFQLAFKIWVLYIKYEICKSKLFHKQHLSKKIQVRIKF